MGLQKPVMVTKRAHEILRRESFARSLESHGDGDMTMGGLVNELADKIQARRNYTDLPEVIK